MNSICGAWAFVSKLLLFRSLSLYFMAPSQAIAKRSPCIYCSAILISKIYTCLSEGRYSNILRTIWYILFLSTTDGWFTLHFDRDVLVLRFGRIARSWDSQDAILAQWWRHSSGVDVGWEGVTTGKLPGDLAVVVLLLHVLTVHGQLGFYDLKKKLKGKMTRSSNMKSKVV